MFFIRRWWQSIDGVIRKTGVPFKLACALSADMLGFFGLLRKVLVVLDISALQSCVESIKKVS